MPIVLRALRHQVGEQEDRRQVRQAPYIVFPSRPPHKGRSFSRPPQRTHESHSPRPQHLTGGGGGGAAAAQPPEGASKPPPPLLAAQTDAGAGAAEGRERGDTSHISPLFNGERAAERPTAAAARERRTQAATGGAQRTRRDGRAAFCAPTAPPSAPAGASGRTRRKGEEGARANAARRAHTDVWRGRQRRRSHNERRSGGIAPHRRERHSPSVPPMSTSSCRKPPKGLRTDTISHLLPRRGLRGIPQCSARTFP